MSDLPEPFISDLKMRFPLDYETRLEGLLAKPSTSIRRHALKGQQKLELPSGQAIPWCEQGQWLETRPSFHLDPLWHAGAYFVQDAASMMIECAWATIPDKSSDPIVADLCAAPGGKSTHLLDLMAGRGLLLSNEVVPKRLNILQENIVKWGYQNVVLSNNSTADLAQLKGTFDVVLVDAPCSGEGLFCVSETARRQWSVGYTATCASRQYHILHDAWHMLKPGGALIYCTCTTNSAENEANVLKLIQHGLFEALPLPFDKIPVERRVSGETILGYQCWPHLVRGKAFFISLLAKLGDTGRQVSYPGRQSNLLQKLALPEYLIKSDDSAGIAWPDDEISAIPDNQHVLISHLVKNFRIRQAGIRICSVRTKDRPHPHLAFANHLSTAFSEISLDRQVSLSYLSGHALSVQGERGWGRVSFKGRSLGWIKNLGNRSNNYYPSKWRIR